MKIESLNLILCVVYRQPNDLVGAHRSTADEFKDFLEKFDQEVTNLPSPTPNILLAGDFNLPHAVWPSGEPKSGATPDERRMLELLSDFCSQNFLIQITDQATHKAGNVLDLMLTNSSDSFPQIEAIPTAPISSHYLVRATTVFSSPNPQPADDRQSKSSFDRVNMFSEDTDWQQIKASLDHTDWTQIFENQTVTQMTDKFTSICESLAWAYAPRRAKSTGKKSHIPRHRHILMRKRTRVRKQFHSKLLPDKRNLIMTKLAHIERQLQDSYRSQEDYDERRAVEKIKSNSKYFYTYAKKRAKLFVPIGPLANDEGKLVSNSAGMAEILSNQYRKVFSRPAPITLNLLNQPQNSISDISFNERSIVRAIDELSNNSAPGEDRFPAVFLKSCKHQLAKPLYLIWRRSLDCGEIPQMLKQSTITPIHKGGSRKEAKNYRLVALTSHLIKIFEKVIRSHIVDFIESNSLLNPNQHGFRAGHSCLSQLLQHHDKITSMLEEGWNVDVVYLDFAKAFDKVDLGITLQKLHNMGITGKVFTWIQAFLRDRQQCVVVGGKKSEFVPVPSGVPQGSVIGPLLFLILLTDIDSSVDFSSVSSFADDTRILSGIRDMDDVANLQADLDAIFTWATRNNATFNSEKFECLRYGRNESIKEDTNYLSNTGTTIQHKDCVKDLGVTVSHDATFTKHIREITSSANLKCGWILRTFKTRDRLLLLTLWKSLVVPILDYCCQLWSPNSPGVIQGLENVQKNYLNKIAGMSDLDYWEQLRSLNLLSLQRRRERYICIYVWKILEGLVPNFGLHSKINARRGRHCVVPITSKIGSQKFQTIRFNSMGVLGPRLFNHLPAHIRDISGCSVNTFKNALDRHLSTIPDEPRVPKLVRYCSKSSNSIINF